MDSVVVVALGMVLGIALTMSIHNNNIKVGKVAKKAVEQCEAELPRNVTCKIIAVEDK